MGVSPLCIDEMEIGGGEVVSANFRSGGRIAAGYTSE